jgi:hypothetical protein
MRAIRWASVRSTVLLVILAFQSLALASLAFSLLVVGSFTGAMLDEFFSDGGHRITLTMLALGSLGLLACAAAAAAAVAIGAKLGYRGTRHAPFWRATVGFAALLQIGWVVMVAGSNPDPGAGDRIGWSIALVAGVVAAIWCAMAWRDRANPVAVPPPPVAVG